jgi:hypothetical protein
VNLAADIRFSDVAVGIWIIRDVNYETTLDLDFFMFSVYKDIPSSFNVCKVAIGGLPYQVFNSHRLRKMQRHVGPKNNAGGVWFMQNLSSR